MTTGPETPKRPWWRRKRWLAAGLFLLVFVYPPLYVLSSGPAAYCQGRGWLDAGTLDVCYRPLWVFWNTPLLESWQRYNWRFRAAGARHRHGG